MRRKGREKLDKSERETHEGQIEIQEQSMTERQEQKRHMVEDMSARMEHPEPE